ncbi:hypothetical protein BC828DRAFT_385473 [Blastocladiella britannica]|nr:hypothetical protein BC828DRAFT_385473 [Blastocladiella britannica]
MTRFANAVFDYQGAPLFLFPTYFLLVTAFWKALHLYRASKSTNSFYLALLLIVVCRTIDNTINHVLSMPGLTTSMFAIIEEFSTVCQFIAGLGITLLNTWRLYRMAPMHHRKKLRVILAMCGISAAASVSLYSYFFYLSGRHVSIALFNTYFSYYAAADCAFNAIVSGLFVLQLRNAFIRPDGSIMRQGIKELLWEVQLLLPTEVVMGVTSNVVVNAVASVDPYVSLYNFFEAMRLLLFIRFLWALNAIMRKQVVAAPTATTVAGGKSGLYSRPANLAGAAGATHDDLLSGAEQQSQIGTTAGGGGGLRVGF